MTDLISREAAIATCETMAPAPAGGPFSHTNSMRVIAYDCASAIRALPAAHSPVEGLLRCEGCGNITDDDERDLAWIRRHGGLSCCPERKMVPIVPAAPAVKVKPLEWVKSHIKPWSEDWHTTSTRYTIRCADEWGWKWSNSVGAHGHESSPEAAKAAAQADYEARILAAIDLPLASPS